MVKIPLLRKKRSAVDFMGEALTILIILAVWIILQAYILPKMGVST